MEAPENEVIHGYLTAYEYNPRRAESLGALARYLRLKGHYRTAILFAEMSLRIPLPDEKLFVETTYYQWLNLDEFAVCAFWCGRYQDSIAACNMLLQAAPPEHRERIIKNREFSEARLQQQPGDPNAANRCQAPQTAVETIEPEE